MTEHRARVPMLGIERHEWPDPRRAWRMVQRSLLVYRHGWMVIFSGFFEPLFYLLSLGIGLGGMIPQVDGLSYTAFVAPGLLASSCMNGAISDGLFNVWFKLHYQKTYESILTTPMRVADVALGELLWTLTRGSLYAGGFMTVVLLLGETRGPRILLSPLAVLALPAALLIAASLSSMALALCSIVRRREDFEYVMGLIVMPMFLFSGIFFPIAQMPSAARWVVEIVPLYHAVELLRACTTGRFGPIVLWHVLYLVGVGTLAFSVAMRWFERKLIA
ncbi:MAG: ABC transporter permease [Vicinamibacterales bacterium]